MSSEKYSGSCICGSVKYEISGEFRAFFHCHCSRCRKASGTGHASNVILNPDTAEWTEGEGLIRSYKVPEADRFGTVFCTNCGSPLPRIAMERHLAVIPAGSLDGSPEIAPTGRNFFGSRTEWSCDTSELPVWTEYPQKS